MTARSIKKIFLSINSTTLGIILGVCGVILISPDALLIRLYSGSYWNFIAGRALVLGSLATIFIWIFPNLRKGFHWKPILIYSFFSTLGTIAFPVAINLTSVANALVILTSAPLIAAIGAHFFVADEKIRRKTWVACFIIFFSIGLIFYGSLSTTGLLGDFLALVTATALAAEAITVRKYPATALYPALCIGNLTAFIIILPFTSGSVSAIDLSLIIINGIIVLGAFFLVLLATRYLTAPEVNLLFLLETLLSPIWIFLVFMEIPERNTLLAGAVIFVTLISHYFGDIRFRQKVPLSSET